MFYEGEYSEYKEELEMKKRSRFQMYMRRTIRNKIVAAAFMLFGILTAVISGGDITFLVYSFMVSIVLFFAKNDIWKEL